MRFQVEGWKPIADPSEAQIRRGLLTLKGYRAPRFAILGDDSGNYVQVGNGGQTCVLEFRDGSSSQHYRAYLESPHPAFPDGAIIQFQGIKLGADEIISIQKVIEAFFEFRNNGKTPNCVGWRAHDLGEATPI